MDYLIIILVALGASALTFFSGFGLGTMLTPAFILFFPPEIAIGATAIVHFLNNLFKLGLIGRHAVMRIILGFGLPGIVGAYFGAEFLGWLSAGATTVLQIGPFESTPINMVIGVLIILFALFELVPALKRLEFNPRWMIPGGALSGFLGGVSGHQGALRSAFLIKFSITKEQFVATGVVIACLIDTARISVYATNADLSAMSVSLPLIAVATIAAFIGAVIGKRLMKKVTIDLIQNIVGIMMIAIGLLLVVGII